MSKESIREKTIKLATPQKTTVDWGFVLQECRHQRMRLEESSGTKEDWASFLDLFYQYGTHIASQLSIYCQRLSARKGSSSVDGKEVIRDTRNALRIAVSFNSNFEASYREVVQKNSIDIWTERVLDILSSQRGDAKCRLFAAQLLSNLVTQNAHTAQKINKLVSFAPSNSQICSSLQNVVVSFDGDDVAESTSRSFNWVDMMLCASKSNNREALAAIVAALHNMFASGVELSTNSLLVSTILRQLIAANSIKGLIQGESSEDMTDAATEWIVILISKYCKEGKLPSLYRAISGESFVMETCLLEQLVLLHCVRSIVDDPIGQATDRYGRLGSKVDGFGSLATHLFLSEILASLLARSFVSKQVGSSSKEDTSLVDSASSTILYILSETLTADSEETSQIRICMGQNTELIPVACKALGDVYDRITLRNTGRNARETLIDDDEQAQMVGLVRLLGNLAYGCKDNQDAIRQTAVPVPESVTDARHGEERGGLHVLLSCTAYSHACFTLREWAVVAIRNVLENNTANQELVEQLEAKQGVQSAVMNDMGIQVNVEPKSGKVEVRTLEKIIG
ncbi:hypothetical protein FisN_4Hh004 [Fistulifera solaris]|uniref:Ataxin-10 domain-containing protein n=1 Tax=Fistulifera solaris TaxID=1519565 RepID=A0A1Z5KQG5_FISSO|nr:hypothetical protein FisN_4Hh004 [Fistulifera solaris]|eukprot:GAX28342.1 hypothetical protein FisN_4Hh004 [Fistulifera solaris]